MFARMVGIIWVVLGILWMAKPQSLKDRLKRRMTRRIKWIIFGFILIFGFSIIASIVKAETPVLKIIGVAALIIAIRFLLLITSKASGKITDWWQKRPLVFFRLWGLFLFAIGVLLILS